MPRDRPPVLQSEVADAADDSQSKTIDAAWVHFREHPLCVKLEDMGLHCGHRVRKLKSDSGEAGRKLAELKRAVADRKADFQKQQASLGLTRQEARDLGYRRDNNRKKSPTPKRPRYGHPAAGDGTYNLSCFLFFCLSHALYDVVGKPGLPGVVSLLAGRRFASRIPMQFQEQVSGWLVGKRHCKHSIWASPTTEHARAHLASLEDPAQKLLFCLLVVSACNSRSVFDDWLRICVAAPSHGYNLRTLADEIYAVLARENVWPSTEKFPVSAGTHYRCELPSGPSAPERRARLWTKTVQLTLGYFAKLRGPLKCDAVHSSGLNALQSMMLMRYMDLDHDEVWTEWSRTYVPAGYTPSSFAVDLNHMLDADHALKAYVKEQLAGDWFDHFLSDVHVEHEACEFRKCIDGHSNNRE